MTERKEQKPRHLQEVNISSQCYVQLTPEGVKGYDNHYAELSAMAVSLGFGPIEPLPLKLTDQGVVFEIWKLMYVFGSMLSPDSTKLPFNTVTLDVGLPLIAREQKLRTIGVKDAVNIKPTDYGKGILGGAFVQGDIPVRAVGALTEMTFGEVCFVFGPDMFMGNRINPLARNAIYLPQV